MQIVFTQHAQERLIERGIIKADVIDAIRTSQEVEKTGFNTARIWKKIDAHSRLGVVVAITDKGVEVVTAFVR